MGVDIERISPGDGELLVSFLKTLKFYSLLGISISEPKHRPHLYWVRIEILFMQSFIGNSPLYLHEYSSQHENRLQSIIYLRTLCMFSASFCH